MKNLLSAARNGSNRSKQQSRSAQIPGGHCGHHVSIPQPRSMPFRQVTRSELTEPCTPGFGMPKLEDGETAVIGHIGIEVDDLEDIKAELTRREGG
ncbi:hypothetical protein ACFWWS_39695, partial [Streptomyces sp. NPDC059083]|uniref:hypothetical protein n=1 Tax=Streptomyces sp. NPDC059083 TaxID=3346721 RepID=UPI0036A02151